MERFRRWWKGLPGAVPVMIVGIIVMYAVGGAVIVLAVNARDALLVRMGMMPVAFGTLMLLTLPPAWKEEAALERKRELRNARTDDDYLLHP